jgi:multiple antibiotic resistance protein
MRDVINTFLLVFAGLFPVVNPLGTAPIFLSLAPDCDVKERDRLAYAVAFNGFWLLVGSLVFGSAILQFFGVTIPAVRVAGGIAVTAMGWRLLNEGQPAEKKVIHDEVEPLRHKDSFYPLTMPLTVGPGSISVAVTLGSHRPIGTSAGHTALLVASAIAGLVAIAAAIYICYRFADSLARFLGPAGINVVVRLSAFILMCIGIEIAWSGVRVLAASLGAAS